MCGIAGLYLPRKAESVEVDLTAMLSVMDHRGPNGSGRHISQDKRYQVAFTRLAIIDLETGDQPIFETNGQRVLVGNGEIYNYKELRQSPGPATYDYATQGDMEVVLPLSRIHGDDFVDHLNGMYALTLYDKDADRLTLVRDRLGVKPLYWTELPGGGVLFASEIKALFASGLVQPAPDEHAVTEFLAHGYVASPRTIFKGVNKLAPGHQMHVSGDGNITERRYWRAAMSRDLPSASKDVEDHLISLLRESVAMQLRSDVPIGVLLSGGIDSGLLVALAAEQVAGPLNTYTVRFEGAAVDETALAREVAQRFGTHHEELNLSMSSIQQMLPKLAWYCDEPLSDAALLPNYLIAEQLSKRTTVALNGSGGDELFAGYGRYFHRRIERRYLSLPRAIREKLIEPAVGAFSEMTAWRLARAAKFFDDRGAYLHDHTTLFPPPILKLIGNRMPLPRIAQHNSFVDFDGPPQTAALFADLETYLPEDLLTLLDRATMAASVEGRVPFLDHNLVEAALAVPPSLRTTGEQQKHLQRRIAGRFLPQSVVEAPKQGFASPVPAWFNDELSKIAQIILTRKETLARGWWTREGIEELFQQPARHAFRIYALLNLELVIRLHTENLPGRPPAEDGLSAFA